MADPLKHEPEADRLRRISGIPLKDIGISDRCWLISRAERCQELEAEVTRLREDKQANRHYP